MPAIESVIAAAGRAVGYWAAMIGRLGWITLAFLAGCGGGSAASPADGGIDSGPLPTANFEARCAGDGVLVCRGFDDSAELVPISLSTETGIEANDNGDYDRLTIDPAIKASGAGALRFEIPGRSSSNHSGAFRQMIGEAFGEGETFYAQFRLRLNPAMVDTDWDDVVGSFPKIVIFHHSSATCNDVEWTQVLHGWYDNTPNMYTHCGMYGGSTDGPNGELFVQQGDYDCLYNSDYASSPGCLKVPADRWVTFYFKAAIGTWGQPDSHLEAFYSIDGGPYQQWTDWPGFTLYAEGDSVVGFDSVYLTTYMTNKDSAADHPTAYAWYDELIVSRQPIAVPE